MLSHNLKKLCFLVVEGTLPQISHLLIMHDLLGGPYEQEPALFKGCGKLLKDFVLRLFSEVYQHIATYDKITVRGIGIL